MTRGWIILSVVVVLMVSVALYLAMGNGQEVENTGDSSAGEIVLREDGTAEVKGSVQDLVARGGSWKCEFTHTTDVGESTGVVYVAEGKVRGNFMSTVPQLGEVASYMVVKDDLVYTWSSVMPQGFKMPVAKGGASAVAESQGNFYAQALDYQCVAWEADMSFFEVPLAVTFVEVTR